MNEMEASFVNLMAQHVALYGEVFSVDFGVEEYGFERKFIQKALKDERIRTALSERGIELQHYNVLDFIEPSHRAKGLTATQLIAANALLDLTDTRSRKKKLQDLNISTQTYQAWLRDPVFNNYVRERSESMLGENQHEAHLALLDKVMGGDVGAIKYFNELSGRFVPESSRSSGTGSTVDVNNLIVSIIEIINDEVHDSETAIRISDRFRQLISARTIAGTLLNEPVTLPTVAPNRELSPELQSLMRPAGEAL